jgi:hypothetical protein
VTGADVKKRLRAEIGGFWCLYFLKGGYGNVGGNRVKLDRNEMNTGRIPWL